MKESVSQFIKICVTVEISWMNDSMSNTCLNGCHHLLAEDDKHYNTSVKIKYKRISQYLCYLNVCNRNNEVWLKGPFVLSFWISSSSMNV